MKARDPVAVAALRSAIAAIDNAEAADVMLAPPSRTSSGHVVGGVPGLGSAEVRRRDLSDADVRAIVSAEVHERIAAARDLETLGRKDAADRLRREAAVLGPYLHSRSGLRHGGPA